MEPAGRHAAHGLEVILERRIPVRRSLRPQPGVVDRDGAVRLGGGLGRQEFGKPGAAEARRPTEVRLEVGREIVEGMRTRKRFRVAAAKLAIIARVVARRRADRVGRLLRGRAQRPRARPAPTRRFRFLYPDAREKTRCADAALRHNVSGADLLGHAARAGELLRLVEITVLRPERRLARPASVHVHVGRPLRHAAAGHRLVIADVIRIVGERGGAGVIPAVVVLAPGIDRLLAPRRAGLHEDGSGERKLVAEIEPRLLQRLVLLIIVVHHPARRRPVVVGIAEIRSAVGQKLGKHIRLRAIENPASARESHDECACDAQAVVDRRGRD